MPATAAASPEHPPCLWSLDYTGPVKHAAAVQAMLQGNGASDDGHLVLHPSQPVVIGSRVFEDPEDAQATRYIALNSSAQPGMLSRRHALLEFDESERRIKVRDLQSLNGLQVNGVKVQDALLQSGDVLTFGGASKCDIGAQPSSRMIKSIWQFKVRGTPEPLPESASHDAGPHALFFHLGALDQIRKSEAVLSEFDLREAVEQQRQDALKATSDAEQVSACQSFQRAGRAFWRTRDRRRKMHSNGKHHGGLAIVAWLAVGRS